MAFGADPVFLTPRFLPRAWGRTELGPWCARVPRPKGLIGEVWAAHPNNVDADGAHFGDLVKRRPREFLGDLGRAPPTLRLVFAGERTDGLSGEGRVGLWRILESRPGARLEAEDGARRRRRPACRAGDLFRAPADTRVHLEGGVAALEAAAAFAPGNGAEAVAPLARVGSADERPARVVWFRDPALSVEVWRLPPESRLEPDGEACHVLLALTPGAFLDGAPLEQGCAVFLPAYGRKVELKGAGATLLVAYPDLVPTAIWRSTGSPDPAAAALSREIAMMREAPVDAVARFGGRAAA